MDEIPTSKNKNTASNKEMQGISKARLALILDTRYLKLYF
jgi:hypothetical protein